MMNTLRGKLIAVTAALMLAALLSVTLAIYVMMRAELIQRMDAEIRGVARATAAATGEWIASRSQVTQAGAGAALAADPMPVLMQAKASGQFDLFYVGFPDKKILFTDNQQLPAGYDATQRPWYTAAVASDKPIMTAPYVDASTGQLVVSFAYAAKEGGNLKGVVAADITLDRVVQQILAVRFSAKGYAMLIGKDGKILVHPSKELLQKSATELAPELTAEAILGAYKNEQASDLKVQGVASFVEMFPVPGTDLTLGVVVDKGSALAPLDKLLGTALGILVLALAIALPLLIAVLTRMLGRLATLRDLMKEISAGGGDLTRTLNVSNRRNLSRLQPLPGYATDHVPRSA